MVQTKPLKKVVYVGRFELPCKNAAAKRAMANAKLFEAIGCHTTVCGIGKTERISEGIDCLGVAFSHTDIKPYLRALSDADIIIGYNLHAILLTKLMRYAKKHCKRIYVDCTEWQSYKNPLKRLDCALVMRFINKRADGIIAVSSLLESYYKSALPVLRLPPLTDLSCKASKPDAKRLVFAGSISKQKEELSKAVTALCQLPLDFTLDIAGCTADEFYKTYKIKAEDPRITFHGKIESEQARELVKNSDYALCIRKSSRKTNAGFPSKLAEAIACSTPVIATDTSDLGLYLKDNKNGFIVSLENLKDDLERVLLAPAPKVENDLFDYKKYICAATDFFLKKRVIIARNESGRGGPFVSHTRLLGSKLSKEFELIPVTIPRARVMLSPIGMHRLKKTLRTLRPDLCVLTGLQLEGYLSAIACKKYNTLLAVRGSSQEALDRGRLFKALLRVLEKRTVILCKNVFAVSDYAASFEPLSKAKNHFGTVYNLAPDISADKKEYSDTLSVLSAGRITTDKGFDILLDVIKKLPADMNVRFTVAGDGSFLEAMKQDISAAGLSDRVQFLGHCTDMRAVYEKADLFMLCSKHETLCNAAIEAQCHGLPVIAAKVGGLSESVLDKKTGSLVSTLNADAFISELTKLYNDRELLTNMSNAAREFVRERFDNQKTISRLTDIFNELLGE